MFLYLSALYLVLKLSTLAFINTPSLFTSTGLLHINLVEDFWLFLPLLVNIRVIYGGGEAIEF